LEGDTLPEFACRSQDSQADYRPFTSLKVNRCANLLDPPLFLTKFRYVPRHDSNLSDIKVVSVIGLGVYTCTMI
jgi:hypothetical protein